MTLRCECKKCVRKKKGSHSVSRYKNREKTHSGDFSHCWNHTEIFPLLVWILILFFTISSPRYPPLPLSGMLFASLCSPAEHFGSIRD